MSVRSSIATLHAGAFLWAFTSTLLGPALPLVTEELDLGYSSGGTVFTVSSAGFLTGSLVAAWVFGRFTLRTLVLASVGALLPLLYLTSLVSSLPLLLVVVGVTGVAGGVLTTLVNAGIADLTADHRAAALSLLNVSFGLGALLAPLFAGAVIAWTGAWKPMYQLTSALVLLVLLLAARSLEPTESKPAPGWRVVLDRSIATVFLAAALEWGFAYWSATYFADVVGAGKALAANMSALFWAGMLLGRLAFGSLLRAADPHRTVTVCATAAVLASATLALNAGTTLSVIGAIALGASLAAVIPSLLATAINANPHHTGPISGTLMFTTGTGSLAAPAFIGLLAGHTSLAAAIWTFPALAALLLLIHATGPKG
ncbi:MFS transporter [Actinokineospora terrae]|uniref:Fucose permease n=1 Tax=Actinokineospora terrae TaxID=155974 RepID=A0A1H9MW03_9PSEU|nr:MFS transporter [Actinokineospora terrae]SER27751.1 Fucose permease [Actinokineospora terrae]